MFLKYFHSYFSFTNAVPSIGLYVNRIFIKGDFILWQDPKKEKSLRHTHQIMLRLTDTEYEIISSQAKAASLPLAEFARRQIMNKRTIIKYELVTDLPELKKLIAEFGKIGSNLNQIARYFNSSGIHSQEIQKSLQQSLSKIYEMKYEVLKLAGNFSSQNISAPKHARGSEYGNS